MFLPLSKEIDNQKLFDNVEKIKNDYLNFLNKDYFFDYSHDYNLTSNENLEGFVPKKTDYFWKVCPIIFNKKIISFFSKDIQDCFTSSLIMSFDVLPVLATFSLLEPHSEIDPHIDTDDHIAMHNYNIPVHLRRTSVVKYHLSLDIPDDGESGLVVLNKKRVLKNGDLNPFDETNTHWAYNRSSKRRGVLIISYLKHELYPIKAVSLK
jgi:hypothetical protein